MRVAPVVPQAAGASGTTAINPPPSVAVVPPCAPVRPMTRKRGLAIGHLPHWRNWQREDRVRISITFPLDDFEKILARADAAGIPFSHAVRRLVALGLDADAKV